VNEQTTAIMAGFFEPVKTYRNCKCTTRHKTLNDYIACALPRSVVLGEQVTADKAYAAIIRCTDGEPWRVYLSTDLLEVMIWTHPETECCAACEHFHEAVTVEPVRAPSGKQLSPEDIKARERAARANRPCKKCDSKAGEPCRGKKGELKIMHGIRLQLHNPTNGK
jgi:hypothetical protein